MSKSNIIGEIKNILFGTETPAVLNFLDAKSGDLILRVEADDFAKDLPLLLVTPDGVIPAEDGEYVLEDGRTIVSVAGIITEVKEAAPAEVEVEVEAPEVELAEEEVVVEETPVVEDTTIEERMSALEKKITEMETMFSELMSSTKDTADFSKMVEEKLDTFVKDTPAELEFKSIKEGFKSMVDENKNKVSGLEAIRNMRKK